MLRAFGALPTEERSRATRARDYVCSLTHIAPAEEARCPVCGRPAGSWEGALNPSFDRERYERLRKGGQP